MPFRHAWLDQIIVAYANSKTKTMLLVIMLNRSRFVYSVLHTLLSLFAFNLDHLTTTYAVSSRTARPNRSSLYYLTVFVFLGVTAAHRYTVPSSNIQKRSLSKRLMVTSSSDSHGSSSIFSIG